MRDHRRLKAFQLADELAIAVYRATEHFPRSEQFGITSQMRRAAVSVATNIVEGCARDSKKEYVNFLNVAFGSLRELGYLIGLAGRLGLLEQGEQSELHRLQSQCAGTLGRLLRSLRGQQ